MSGLLTVTWLYVNYAHYIVNGPWSRFGNLSASIFRACRLVVDTGMHALGWTRQEAIDYMLQHSASSKENTVSEVAGNE